MKKIGFWIVCSLAVLANSDNTNVLTGPGNVVEYGIGNKADGRDNKFRGNDNQVKGD